MVPRGRPECRSVVARLGFTEEDPLLGSPRDVGSSLRTGLQTAAVFLLRSPELSCSASLVWLVCRASLHLRGFHALSSASFARLCSSENTARKEATLEAG